MKYLLETDFLLELIRHKPKPEAFIWLEKQYEPDLFISALSIGELNSCISGLPGSLKKKELENWFHELIKRFESRILPVTLEISLKSSYLEQKQIPKTENCSPNSILIASTALIHNFTIITFNSEKFLGLGVDFLEPSI